MDDGGCTAVVGSKFVQVGGDHRPRIWFSKKDALARAVIPTCENEEIFVFKDYAEWYNPIVGLLLAHGRLPSNRHKACEVRRAATRHVLEDGVLFRWGLDGVLLRCLTHNESIRCNARSPPRFVW